MLELGESEKDGEKRISLGVMADHVMSWYCARGPGPRSPELMCLGKKAFYRQIGCSLEAAYHVAFGRLDAGSQSARR